jgi:hypothetical protein
MLRRNRSGKIHNLPLMTAAATATGGVIDMSVL